MSRDDENDSYGKSTRNTARKARRGMYNGTPSDFDAVRDLHIETRGGMHRDKGSGQRLRRLPWRDGRVRWAMHYGWNLTPKQRQALEMYYGPEWQGLRRPTEAECAEVLGITREAFADRLDGAEAKVFQRETRRRPPKGRGEIDPGAVVEMMRRLRAEAEARTEDPTAYQHLGEGYVDWWESQKITATERMMRGPGSGT